MISRYDRRIVIVMTLTAMVVLMGLQYFLQVSANEQRALTTAKVVKNQIGKILDDTEKAKRYIINSLKIDYIQRATAISLALDYRPEGTEDSEFLNYIAEIMGVDEVHIIDDTGTIVGGSRPDYYGMNFDDGTQIGYFKPMLKNKTLSLCQDITPNTAEGENMMYAAVWNRNGTYIVQVGLKPVRVMNYLYTLEIPELVSAMPVYDGLDIVIAGAESDTILGSTIKGMEGNTLQDYGIHVSSYVDKADKLRLETVDGTVMYCSMMDHESYRIVSLQERTAVQESLGESMLIMFAYLTLVSLIINLILRHMFQARENALRDPMTGLLNRRSFEQLRLDHADQKADEGLVALSADINGLKEVNDIQGHDAGDHLIQGAAACLEGAFGDRGTLYRIGGDEFAGVLKMKNQELPEAIVKLEEMIMEWNRQNEGMELSIARGFARSEDYPEDSLGNLFSYSDHAMYDNKRLYYERTGKDRRKRGGTPCGDIAQELAQLKAEMNARQNGEEASDKDRDGE